MSQAGGFWDDAEVISAYSQDQAIEDGVLADVTEWASHDKGFFGGFTCRVVMTAKLWDAVSRPVAHQDTRGRAHDVLWMASLAARRAIRLGDDRQDFDVLLHVGRSHKQRLRVILDGSGVTIGFAEDEW